MNARTMLLSALALAIAPTASADVTLGVDTDADRACDFLIEADTDRAREAVEGAIGKNLAFLGHDFEKCIRGPRTPA